MNYDDEDVIALRQDPRLIAGVDAFRRGCCTLQQMINLVYVKAPFFPRCLSPFAFSDIVFALAEELKTACLTVPDTDKEIFADFYLNRDEPDE